MPVFILVPPPLASLPYEWCNKLFLKTMGVVIEFRIIGEEKTKNWTKGIVALSDRGTSTGAQRESMCRMLFPYARFPPVLMNVWWWKNGSVIRIERILKKHHEILHLRYGSGCPRWFIWPTALRTQTRPLISTGCSFHPWSKRVVKRPGHAIRDVIGVEVHVYVFRGRTKVSSKQKSAW